ncbi:hypothetical protein [Erythrobacter sp. F6033]|uniref:hypothetical protein n=1 Tax=Erythrobacter sp. F6033 TaxID=2926401 RepID=UPI001FF310F7|nr:hypothetical protein [Erythrobacter sp. F6033]MCK0128670.1 hypothetical protein [Erythrobacter sp. F6033]
MDALALVRGVEALIAQEVSKSYRLPIAEVAQPDAEGRAFTLAGSLELNEFIVDSGMLLVLSEWVEAAREGRPVIDPETSSSTPDFWENFDRVQDDFMMMVLNRLLELKIRSERVSPNKTVASVYSRIIEGADFDRGGSDEVPGEVQKAKSLLYDDDGSEFPPQTPGYTKFIELSDALFDAQMELFELPQDAPPPLRNALEEKVLRAETALNVQGNKAEFDRAQRLIKEFEDDGTGEDERSQLRETLSQSEIDSIAEPGRVYHRTTLEGIEALSSPDPESGWQYFELTAQEVLDTIDWSLLDRLGVNRQSVVNQLPYVHRVRATFREFQIRRNWLDFDLFKADYWDHDELVSDGAGGGILPVIPESIVLVPSYQVTRLKCSCKLASSGDTTIVANIAVPEKQQPKIKESSKNLIRLAKARIGGKKQLAFAKGFGANAAIKSMISPKKISKTRLMQRGGMLRALRQTDLSKIAAMQQAGPQVQARRGGGHRSAVALGRGRGGAAANPKGLAAMIGKRGGIGAMAFGFKNKDRIAKLIKQQQAEAERAKRNRKKHLQGTFIVESIDSDAINHLQIGMTPLRNGSPSGSTVMVANFGQGETEKPFSQEVMPGNYRFNAFFKGEEVFKHTVSVSANAEPPALDLIFAIEEDLIAGRSFDPADDGSGFFSVFGYGVRAVPQCPK